MKKILIFVLLFTSPCLLFSQGEEIEKNLEEFKISLEFRPRAQLGNGYRQLRNDTTHAAFYVSQRSRLYINYRRPQFIFHTSIQDIRVWGEDDPRATDGTLQVFETYVEPTIAKNLSVRIGRQKIMYDNQRLFAQNNWRQNGGSHDAVRFIYQHNKLATELIGAYNQNLERTFETDYSPGFKNYKMLFSHYLNYRLSDQVTLTTLNVADGFQDNANSRTTHYRFTSGGRVEYEKDQLYLTLAGYYQYGETPQGENLSAFYLQPEAKYKLNKQVTFRLGAEIFSGDDATKDSHASHSFDALYGVNHRFLGTMDYFIRFPQDFNNAGIIDPYLFFFYNLNEKLVFRVDGHLFYSENNFMVDDQVISKYLGFENDLLFTYLPNNYTTIDLGFSWMMAEESMEWIKGGGDSSQTPYWSYLMVTFKPDLFNWTGKTNIF